MTGAWINRRNFVRLGSLVLAAAASIAIPAPAGAQELVKLNVQLPWLPNAENTGEFVALEKGFYKEAGLDVTLLTGGPGLSAMQQVATGVADIGIVPSSFQLLQAVSEGIPVQAIAVGLQNHPAGMFSLKSANILKPEDLKGKTIGGQSAAMLMRVFLAATGLKEDELNIVNIGSTVEALAIGKVDAAMAWESNLAQLRPIAGNYNVIRLSETPARMTADVYFTKMAFLESRPEVVARYLQATKKAWDYTRDHQEEAVAALLKNNPALKKEIETASLSAILTYMYVGDTPWGTMSVDSWKAQIDILNSMGVFKSAPPKAEQVMSTALKG